MNYNRFYAQLFSPLEVEIGPLDPETNSAVMGFEGGGPLNFCTIGAKAGGQFITYVSCELAVREEQLPSYVGRFELLCSCDDEHWVRSILSELGRMSMQTTLDIGHTIDIGQQVGSDTSIQGVYLEGECGVQVDGVMFAVFRVIGITRAEMEFKRYHGSDALIDSLKAGGVYPHTIIGRDSVALSPTG